MSKRVRGAVRPHRRPGTRAPSERPGTRRPSTATAATSQLEMAEVIAEDIVEERPAEARADLERATRTTTRVHHRIKPGSILAARAATEYVYVAQDMRRIAAVAGVLVGLLIVLWALIVVLKVVPLPFY